VRDMGKRIPADVQSHLLEQYLQTLDVAEQEDSDLGLGLYISRKLVERHAGHLDVQSVPGNGSIFSVVLPLVVEPTTENEDVSKLEPHTQAVWTIVH
jgi:signal transduction histidine kinase